MIETWEQIWLAAQIFFSEDGKTGRDAGEGWELLASLLVLSQSKPGPEAKWVHVKRFESFVHPIWLRSN